MSFFTGLVFYRPCSPPPITADDLSRLVGRIVESGMLTDSGLRALKLKFGESIDQDDDGLLWTEETVPGVSELCEVEWDVHLERTTLRQMLDSLASDDRRVYRAFLGLGAPTGGVLRPITRENSPENEIDYCPYSLSLEIGPIESYDLQSEAPLHVGWIGLTLSGYGYLYPWTLADVVRRLEAAPEIQRLAEICRSFWPVPADPPPADIVGLRREFRRLWPYGDFEKPWDWYWGLQESG